MAKKTKITPEAIAVFHEAMVGTKLLKQRKVQLAPKKAKRIVAPKPIAVPEIFVPQTLEEIGAVGSEEFISYKQTAVSHKILRKLRKGQYNVDAILDLHGMTVAKANSAVAAFLQQCLQRDARVALIIHGKGQHSQMPILKNKLNLWLRSIDEVLAFCSAAPIHGSRGALYVLLKQTTSHG